MMKEPSKDVPFPKKLKLLAPHKENHSIKIRVTYYALLFVAQRQLVTGRLPVHSWD